MTNQKARTPALSLYFFGVSGSECSDKYAEIVSCVRKADDAGLEAVWFPERHFDEFGGFSPNPAILAASVAPLTKQIRIRGSIIAPLHSPLRTVENWSMVDGLSGGRAGLALASGWHKNDFILNPDAWLRRRETTYRQVETLRQIWNTGTSTEVGVDDEVVKIGVFPRSTHKPLDLWLTSLGNPETFERAGATGVGIVTNLVAQHVNTLEKNIHRYREARIRAGHHPTGNIVLLVHTLLRETERSARDISRGPLERYLDAAVNLTQRMASTADGGGSRDAMEISEADRKFLLQSAATRYMDGLSLIGEAVSCQQFLHKMYDIGVSEISCFVDFVEGADVVAETVDRLIDLWNSL